MMLYIWHIMTLFTIPFVGGNVCSAAEWQHLSTAGAEVFQGLAQPVRAERRERPSHASAQSLPCCPKGGQRSTAREQSLVDPQTSFCFAGSCETNHSLQFFKLQETCLEEETEQTELTDVLPWNFGLIFMYLERKKIWILCKNFDRGKKSSDENIIFILLRTFNPEDLNINFSN